ncbi:MAG: site-2 protease family protein [Actinomycetota bacterium]
MGGSQATTASLGSRAREGKDPLAWSFVLLRIKGIPIGAHWTWLFVFALVTWTLATRLFPATYPGLPATTYWAMAGVAAVIFFASIVLHEMGHALTALREGMRIEGITLWLFGGVARFSSMFPSPGAEAKIALAGPAVSLVLAIGFAALARVGGELSWAEPVRGVADYLARINGILLAFNLVPALPLDGGRVLRAYLWRRQESFEAATRSAARAGRIFGFLLVGMGLLGLFTGSGTGGLWIAFIGWFLVQAAQGEELQASLRSAFHGLRVRDLMTRHPSTVAPDWTIGQFLQGAAGPRGYRSYPVVEGDRVVGLLSVRAASQVASEASERITVGDVMLTHDQIPTLPPDAGVFDALDVLQDGPGRAVVLEDGRLAGILSVSDVGRAAELRRMRGVREPRPARGAGGVVWFIVGLAILLAAAYFYRPPLAVISPGPAFDVTPGIKISGVPTDEVDGKYLLTSVSVSRPNALGAVVALFHPDREVLALSAVIPRGVNPERFVRRQRTIFEESRMIAAGAAARAVGMSVTLRGNGARVVSVVPDSPAEGRLRPGDVIVGIDGRDIDLADEVGREIRSAPAGSDFTLMVERGSGVQEVTVRSARLEQAGEGLVAIGVALQTRDFSVMLPFEVDFVVQDIGGPSAGLAYAMAIADLLSPDDLAAGRTIAATGAISIDGDVGPVGGVAEKAAGVQAGGADIFLVPSGEVELARRPDLRVRGVESLEESLEVLRTSARQAA